MIPIVEVDLHLRRLCSAVDIAGVACWEKLFMPSELSILLKVMGTGPKLLLCTFYDDPTVDLALTSPPPTLRYAIATVFFTLYFVEI